MMKQVRITVMKMARYDDLIARFENPIEHACVKILSEGGGRDAWGLLAPKLLGRNFLKEVSALQELFQARRILVARE